MVSHKPERPVAAWLAKERRGDEVVPALTLVLRSGGCAWNRCLMCGYRHFRYPRGGRPLADRIRAQMSWVTERYLPGDYRMVKIFTSGSFLDPREIPLEVRSDVLSAFRGADVIVETRPEFVTEETVRDCMEDLDGGRSGISFTVAMGLETSDDRTREKCIDKGFTFRDFVEASRVARTGGAGVKAYLLQKPPYLTEGEAVGDVVRSVRDAAPHADSLSLNPCTVQKGTEVERLWRAGEYRPPYLWSVILALSRAEGSLICDPVGGGSPRGPHNCGTCDRILMEGIRDYNLSGDRSLLRALLAHECPCRAEWEFVLREERPWCMPLGR